MRGLLACTFVTLLMAPGCDRRHLLGEHAPRTDGGDGGPSDGPPDVAAEGPGAPPRDAEADTEADVNPMGDGRVDGSRQEVSRRDGPPAEVATPPELIRRLAVGTVQACAIRPDGSLWCWGRGAFGDGTTPLSRGPGPVPALEKAVVQVACGGAHTMAITADRSLWLWGDNSLNQLGDLFTGYRTEPWRSPALAELTVGASAWTATCAIRTGGTVWCWGRNNYGQIGDGTTMARSYPVQVRGIQDEVVEISVGVGSDRVCARKLDGSVWCWGFGYGPTPKRLVELGDSVAQVSSGGMGVCVRKTDGTLWCWGANVQGFVGDGTTIRRDQPVQVTALGDAVAQVAAGDTHVCARKTDGSVWCWGSNLSGELGNGTRVPSASPVRVAALGNDVVELAAGDDRNCARKADESIWCWGSEANGDFVPGMSHDVLTPEQIMFPP